MKELLTFPCQYLIKIIGQEDGNFESSITEIIEQHVRQSDILSINSKPSAKGNYCSVSATFLAQDKEQVESLCKQLKQHKSVSFLL